MGSTCLMFGKMTDACKILLCVRDYLCCTIDAIENWLKRECLCDSQNWKDMREKFAGYGPTVHLDGVR
jgi:hypothetical protein